MKNGYDSDVEWLASTTINILRVENCYFSKLKSCICFRLVTKFANNDSKCTPSKSLVRRIGKTFITTAHCAFAAFQKVCNGKTFEKNFCIKI